MHHTKVRADTNLAVGEWSDEVVVVISSSDSGSSDSSSSSAVAYIVPSVIVAVILIILVILVIIYLVHSYRNRIKYHDTVVSISTLYSNFDLDINYCDVYTYIYV